MESQHAAPNTEAASILDDPGFRVKDPAMDAPDLAMTLTGNRMGIEK
jgi:hypothetical protein